MNVGIVIPKQLFFTLELMNDLKIWLT